jgi:IclR family pca regulon transcriptional regulator
MNKPSKPEADTHAPHRTNGKSGPSIAEEIEAMTGDPSFMTSLARGLAVLTAFSDQRRTLTIAQISHKTGIPRAAVRRCLYTLKQLGYASSDANNYSLKPKVLTLGYSYLSSCSLAVLENDEVLYVARSSTSRIMSVALNVGSRLPAYCTSLGRAILSFLPEQDLSNYLEHVELRAFTPHTVVSEKKLREMLTSVRLAGYALIEEELEVGLRSIAVPVRGASGNVVAALNIGAQASRVTRAQMEQDFLPLLLKGSRELAALLP